MKISSNNMVKIIVPAVLVVGVVVGVKSCNSKPAAPAKNSTAMAGALANLSPDELKSLGVEGDTPEDTLRTLVGTLNKVRADQKALSDDNATLRKQNEQLSKRSGDVSGQVGTAVEGVRQQYDQQLRELKEEQQRLQGKLETLSEPKGDEPGSKSAAGIGNSNSDIPLGLGLDGLGGSTGGIAVAGSDGLLWVTPTDQQAPQPGQPAGKTPGFPTSFLDNNPITRQKAELEMVTKGHTTETGANGQSAEAPVYTLPENSTLVGSRAMTALLGRIPVNGTVTDPYPFKVMIGKDNLAANGIELPEVEGAIVSGSASGDWTLSCVRGQVNSITFVFADGTVRTLPPPQMLTTGNAGNSGTHGKDDTGTTGGIGWLSDENGIPCISGERKSNASTYLPTIFALSAAAAAGDAFAQGEQTTQTNGYGGVTSSLTGDAGKAALGKALSGGMKETTDWVKQRYGQTFDAIYVPPGAHLAVHITRQLNIDYEDQGRKVRYDFTLPGEGGGSGGLD